MLSALPPAEAIIKPTQETAEDLADQPLATQKAHLRDST